MGTGSGGTRLVYGALGEHGSGGGSTSIGNTFRENLLDAMNIVPLNRDGTFGRKSKRKGSKGIRIVECSDPVRTAFEFQAKASKNFAHMSTIPGKGYIMKMRDGTLITYRYISSSKDHSPVVELTVKGLDRLKSQKIHFVQRGAK